MKKGKRNLVIAAVLLFVCAAVWLNWSYNKNAAPKTPDADMVLAEDEQREQALAAYGETLSGEDTAAVLGELGEGESLQATSGYFAEARLTRQQSRDNALDLLEQAASSDGASQEVIDSAMNEIAAMATVSLQEAQMENLLLAKGFSDCVVFIGGEEITVAVPAPIEGLSQADVARITDVVLGETALPASALRVIEVKASV